MDLLEKYYNDLCGLIYQIPLNKDGWFHFSKELLKILNVSYVHIQAIDFSYNVLSFSNGVGLLPLEAYASAELDYLRYPTEADPRWGNFWTLNERVGINVTRIYPKNLWKNLIYIKRFSYLVVYGMWQPMS